MASFEGHVTIAAGANLVFEALADHRHFPHWMDGIVRCRRIGRGAPRLGSRTELVLIQGGLQFALTAEIVELDPEERLTVSLIGEAIVGESAYRLSPAPKGATRVENQFRLSFKGLLRPLALATGPIVQRKQRADLRALKAYLERDRGRTR